MKASVYNMQGEKIEEMELPAPLFEVPENPDLVYQVATSQMANQRKVIAHTKHRGEVSGGGRKPWAQKHTGRARHGSIRSPLWRKGGVVFGPRATRVYKKDINKKMLKKAALVVLSEKARKNLVVVLDTLALDEPKTKVLYALLKKLPSFTYTSALVISRTNANAWRAARNIPSLRVIGTTDMNAFDLLSSKFVILPKETIQTLESRFLKHAI